MLYFLDGTFYFTSPELIKKTYRVRINDYLIKIRSASYMRLFPDEREILLNEIIAGIQIPATYYAREAFVDIPFCGGTEILNVRFLNKNFEPDYGLFSKHIDDKYEDAEKLFFPTYDINHQGKVGSLEYKEIFEKSTGTTVLRYFLEMYCCAIPQQAKKDIIIKVDEKSSFMVKSDATMQSYYNVMVQEYEENYFEDRVFAIINGDVYHYSYSKNFSRSNNFLGDIAFNEFAGGVTNAAIRKRRHERVNDFVERYFSIPDDAVVYTIPELEERFAPEI